MGGWVFSCLLVWFFPSVLAICNPFLAPVSQAIKSHRPYVMYLGAYFSGLFRDIVLSSPRLGLLALSSLLVCVAVYRLSRLFSFEGWQGFFVVALLAGMQFLSDVLLCSFFGRPEPAPFFVVWSWKSFFLFVVLSCVWALMLGFITVAFRWCTKRTLRRSS